MGSVERLTIDLPAELYPILERLAREQARAPQGQASWIVRAALRRAAQPQAASQQAPERRS